MSKITILKDCNGNVMTSSGEQFYPVTTSKATYVSQNKTLFEELENLNSAITGLKNQTTYFSKVETSESMKKEIESLKNKVATVEIDLKNCLQKVNTFTDNVFMKISELEAKIK